MIKTSYIVLNGEIVTGRVSVTVTDTDEKVVAIDTYDKWVMKYIPAKDIFATLEEARKAQFSRVLQGSDKPRASLEERLTRGGLAAMVPTLQEHIDRDILLSIHRDAHQVSLTLDQFGRNLAERIPYKPEDTDEGR